MPFASMINLKNIMNFASVGNIYRNSRICTLSNMLFKFFIRWVFKDKLVDQFVMSVQKSCPMQFSKKISVNCLVAIGLGCEGMLKKRKVIEWVGASRKIIPMLCACSCG